MQRLLAGAFLAALFAVAACGGSGQDAKAAPTGASGANGSGAVEAASAETDLFAFAAGARFVAAPSDADYADLAYSPYNLIDETPATDTRAEAGRAATYVLELPERTEIARIVFDSDGLTNPEKSPKRVKVEVSDSSDTAGYTTVLETDLAQSANNQSFVLPTKATGRWVRLTLESTHGADYYGLTGFRGYGRQLTSAASVANVSGTYEGASGWGKVHLRQEGTRVIGCYEYLQGVLSGGSEGRLVKVEMTEQNPAGVDHQFGLFAFSADGNSMFGLTRGRDDGPDAGWKDFRSATKVSNDIGDCPMIPGWRGAAAAEGQLASQLQTEGRARLDGVNFDFNSATIQPASRPLLDQVAQMLKSHPDWKITLEGHTDNIGGEAFNQTLSAQRAAAVKAYLVAQGVAASSLTSVGFSFTRPVASNDTQAGRAQNRRVEIVKG